MSCIMRVRWRMSCHESLVLCSKRWSGSSDRSCSTGDAGLRFPSFRRLALESSVCERWMETLICTGWDPVIPAMWLWYPQTSSNSLPQNCKCASRATAWIHTICSERRTGRKHFRPSLSLFWTVFNPRSEPDLIRQMSVSNPDSQSVSDQTFCCERSETWSRFKVDQDYRLTWFDEAAIGSCQTVCSLFLLL